MPEHAWMIRAGTSNTLADQVEHANAVAIGWAEMGDISGLDTRDAIKRHYRQAYPDHSNRRTNVNAGQIYRFAREISQGDYALTYDKASRELIVGIIDGPNEYNEALFSADYPHIRRVRWLKRISRDQFSLAARNSMGSTLTVFNLDSYLDEIHQQVQDEEVQPAPPIAEIEEEKPPFHDEVKAQADELIADLISRLDPYDFQYLVAAVLRAMGFRAVSSPPGRDRGIDIVAHPDPFGFERPRIKVQVKHRLGSASGPEMRQFLGVLRAGDNGLYVSTGGFTSDARTEASSSREPVTLLDREAFVRLLQDNYENLEAEYKALVPLVQVWLPAK